MHAGGRKSLDSATCNSEVRLGRTRTADLWTPNPDNRLSGSLSWPLHPWSPLPPRQTRILLASFATHPDSGFSRCLDARDYCCRNHHCRYVVDDLAPLHSNYPTSTSESKHLRIYWLTAAF